MRKLITPALNEMAIKGLL